MSYKINTSRFLELRAINLHAGNIFFTKKTLAEAIEAEQIFMVIKSSNVNEEDLSVFNLCKKTFFTLESDWQVTLCDATIEIKDSLVVIN